MISIFRRTEGNHVGVKIIYDNESENSDLPWWSLKFRQES